MPTKKKTPPPAAPAWFPRIGELWPGQGIYTGIVRGEPGLPDYHLFLPTDAGIQRKDITWGSRGKTAPGATSTLDGFANTAALVASGHDYPGAQWAHGLRADGHSDWYLPSRRELRLLWVNVPELFEEGWYWSSTQYSAGNAWGQDFSLGYQDVDGKDLKGRARAVRRFLIA